MGKFRAKTVLLSLALGAIVLATLTSIFASVGSIHTFWEDRVWTHVPAPLAFFLSNTAIWWMILAVGLSVALLARKIHTTAKDGMQGGARVVLGCLGGGGRASWRKLSPKLHPVLRNAVHIVGVFPDDRRTEATEPLASRLAPAADFVEVPPGQSNHQAALAAHENYSATYRPVLRRGFDRAARALMVLHQGGNTGAVAAIYACEELAASPKETVFLVMGDSPDPLVAAIHDPQLYDKARRARADDAEPRYAWTRGKPEVVEVTA